MLELLTYRLLAIGGRLFASFSDGTLLPMVRGADGEPTPLAELLTQAATPAELSDDQLATLDADITAATEAIDPTSVTPEQLAELQQAVDTVQAIRAEAARRDDEAATRAAEAEAALAAIRGEDGTEGGGEDGEPDAAEETTTDEPAQPADAEPAEAEAEAQPEPIAAGAAPARRRPRSRGWRCAGRHRPSRGSPPPAAATWPASGWWQRPTPRA